MDWTYLVGKRIEVGLYNQFIGGIVEGITPDGWMIINCDSLKWNVKLDDISRFNER